MLRIAVLRLCLACGLAAAAAGAVQAQQAPAGEGWRRISIALRPAGSDQTGVDLVLKLRSFRAALQTGPDTGGTGYAGELAFQRPMGDWKAYGHLGLAGDTRLNAVREPWHGALGARRAFDGGFDAGARVDYRPTTVDLTGLRELSAYGALQSGDWRYQLSLTRGLTVESPALALALGLRRSF